MKFRPTLLLPPLAMLSMFVAPPAQLFASSHREAPITALDQKADITDWYAFVSPEHPDHVVMILNVPAVVSHLSRIPAVGATA